MTSPTFDQLITDLERDYSRAQPVDALQYIATWSQQRLEEQRTRIRATLASGGSPHNIPDYFYRDAPMAASSFHHSLASTTRGSVSAAMQSPFGVLNVPGNALLPDNVAPGITFKIDSAPGEPFSATEGTMGDLLTPPAYALGRRPSVSAESIPLDATSDEALPFFPKDEQQLQSIKQSIKPNFMFRGLSEEQEKQVVGAMEEVSVPKGEVVIRQGDDGDYFYITESGLLHCYVLNDGSTPARTDVPVDKEYGAQVAELRRGDFFGELALMYGHPRAATIVAAEPSVLWRIDRITFRTIILKSRHRIRSMYESFLATVPLLESLNQDERSKIADALTSKTFEDGEAVVKEGEQGDTFFFIEQGEAIATKRYKNDQNEYEDVVVGKHGRGDYFGELSLLRMQPRAATVSAVKRTDPSQPKLTVAALGVAGFTRLLGPLKDLMERKASIYSKGQR